MKNKGGLNRLFSQKKGKRKRRLFRNFSLKPITEVFHGGTKKPFDDIDLSCGRDNCDFGSGFYTAVRRSDAKTMMLNSKNRNNGKICKFIFNYKLAKDDRLNILEFETADEKWLDFITDNRIYEKPHNWDIVIGPTADGDAFFICNRYDKGMITAEEAIERLNTQQYSTQVLFHTDRSIQKKYLEEVKA